MFPSAVRVVYSDAIDTGFSGDVVEHDVCVTHGQWTAFEASGGSCLLFILVLLLVANKLVNACIHWFTNHHNIVWILQVGSKKSYLQEIMLRVLSLAIQFQTCLESEFVPRKFNEKQIFTVE